jgi:glycerol kinase
MTMSYLLGLDQGTTQTTAIILDDQGRVAAQRSAPLPIRFPRAGWVEQDPWDILRTVREAAEPLLEAYPAAAMGLDNQGETFLLWDRETGEPLTPAIVWQDKRGQQVCQQLAARVDAGWVRQRTGLLLDSYFSAPKLRYVLDERPELQAAAEAGRVCFGTTESWVLWQLSGGKLHVTDASTASRTLLFNLNDLTWDADLLALFDVPAAMLPEVRPAAGYVGDARLGGRPLPVHALLVDQQAALFGQACLAPGEVKCTFGTGSFVLMNTGDKPQASRHGLLSTVAWDWPGQRAYALDGGIFVTGAAVQWLAETLGLLPNVAASDQAARQATDDGVVCVPALAGLGPPHWEPDVRGAFFGLSRATTPADLARAMLRGIACCVVEVVQAMEQDAGQLPAALKVDGGPAGNSFLMQSLADLLNKEVHVAAAREATAMGVANLAGHSALGWSLEAIRARWQAEAVYVPRMAASKRARHWERWQRCVEAVRGFHRAD